MDLLGTCLAAVVVQLSLQSSRFSTLILSRNGSTTITVLPSILTYGSTCLPNSMYSDALARAGVPYQVFRYNITCLSRLR